MPRARSLALIAGVFFLSASPARAAKPIPSEELFSAAVPAPSRLAVCADAVWVASEESRALLRLHALKGEVLSRASLPGREALASLTCFKGELLAGLAGRTMLRVGTGERSPLPGKGRLLELVCAEGSCYALSETLHVTRDLKKWDPVALPRPDDLPPLRAVSDDLNPFEDWQDKFHLAKGKWFRVSPPPPGGALLLLDPVRAQVGIQTAEGWKRWGDWGSWEGKWMFPKAFARVSPGVIAALDGGTQVVSFFTVSGGFLGTLTWRVGSGTGFAVAEDRVYASDFTKNLVRAFRWKKAADGTPFAQATPDGISRVNFFRDPKVLEESSFQRCLSCHDGLYADSLGGFRSARFHHAKPLDCTSCHDAHHSTKNASKLKLDPKTLCASCHDGKADPKTNHAKPGTCGTCHAGHSPHDKMLKAEPAGLCLSCHGQSKKPANHPLGGSLSCTSCHQVHGGERAKSFGVSCASCHQEVKAIPGQVHLEKIRPKKRAWHAGEGACLECHAPHAKKADTRATCTTCHATRGQVHRQAITISDTFRAQGIVLESNDRISCKTCHQVHGKAFRNPAQIVPFCASCHGKDAQSLYSDFHRKGKRHP